MPRLYLSPPDVGSAEVEFVLEAFESNWVAPVGPQLDAFEREFAEVVGSRHAVGVSSGTAALHLAAARRGGSGGRSPVLVAHLHRFGGADYLSGRQASVHRLGSPELEYGSGGGL